MPLKGARASLAANSQLQYRALPGGSARVR
jgi:hypothetical protein